MDFKEELLYSMALTEAKMKVVSAITEEVYPAVAFQISDYRKDMGKMRDEILENKSQVSNFNEVMHGALSRKNVASVIVIGSMVMSACGVIVETGTTRPTEQTTNPAMTETFTPPTGTATEIPTAAAVTELPTTTVTELPTETVTEMPTLTLTPEPTATLIPEPTVAETQVIELENTICSECLLPRAIQKDYEGVYDGITVKYSFAIDKTMLNHFPGTIVDFDLNVKDYPELPELIALNTLKIHYLGWKSDNSNSLTSFDDYIEMVKNGGGQYTSIASVDDLSVPKAKRVEFKLVTVDPNKRVTYIDSIEPNILAQNQSESIWPVQTLDGDFEIRRTGRILTSLNQVSVDYPEHTKGRLWMFAYINNIMSHFICVDDLEYANRGLWPSYGINPQIVEELSKIFHDLFDNERGKITSPPYFHIDFRK